MKNKSSTMILLAVINICLYITTAQGLTELEKDFIATYQKAFENSDLKTLESFLHTKDADPEALEFYKMMMTVDLGSKISSITLISLTPEEMTKASQQMPSISGGMSKLPLTPSKKLVIKINANASNRVSSTTSTSYVSEVNGKLLILIPIRID